MRRLTWNEVLEQKEPKTRRRRVAYVLASILGSFKKAHARHKLENWQLILKLFPEGHDLDFSPGKQRALISSVTDVLKKRTTETAMVCAVAESVALMFLERFGDGLVVPFDRMLQFVVEICRAISGQITHQKTLVGEELEKRGRLRVRLLDLALGLLGKTLQTNPKSAFALFVSTLLKPLAMTQAKLKLESLAQKTPVSSEGWSKIVAGILEKSERLLDIVLFPAVHLQYYKSVILPRTRVKRMKVNNGKKSLIVIAYVKTLFQELEKDVKTEEQFLLKWAGSILVTGYVKALRRETANEVAGRRFRNDRELQKRLREDTTQRSLEFAFFRHIARIVTSTPILTEAAVKVFATLVDLRLFQTNRDPIGGEKRRFLEYNVDEFAEKLDDSRFQILTTIGQLNSTFLDPHLGKLVLYATASERGGELRMKFTNALVACYTPRCMSLLLDAVLEAVCPKLVLEEIAMAFEVHAGELSNQQREELWKQLLEEKAPVRDRVVVIRMIAAILNASIQTSNRAGLPSGEVPKLLAQTVKIFLTDTTIKKEPHLLKLVIAVLRIWINCKACGIEGLSEIPLPGPKVVGKYLEKSTDEKAVPETLCLINLLKQRLAGLDAGVASDTEPENWDSVFEVITEKITKQREVVAMLTSSDLQGLLSMISKPKTRRKLLKLILEIVTTDHSAASMLADAEFYEIQELRELWVPVVARILGKSVVEDQRAEAVFKAISKGTYEVDDLLALHKPSPKVHEKGRALMEVLISLPDGYLPSAPSVIPLLVAAEICGCLDAPVGRSSVVKLFQTDHLADNNSVKCLQWMFTHSNEDSKEAILSIWRSLHKAAARVLVWESLSDSTKTWLVEPYASWIVGMRGCAIEGHAAEVTAEIEKVALLEKRGAETSALSIRLADSTIKLLGWPNPGLPVIEKMDAAKVKLVISTLSLRRVCAHRYCGKSDLSPPSWGSENSFLQDVAWPIANVCLSPDWTGSSEEITLILKLVSELLRAKDLPEKNMKLILKAIMRFGLSEFATWDPETGIDPQLSTTLFLARTCLRQVVEKGVLLGPIFQHVKIILAEDPSLPYQRLFALQVIFDVLASKVKYKSLKAWRLLGSITSAVRLTKEQSVASQKALLRWALEVMIRVIGIKRLSDKEVNLCLTVLSPLHAESVKLLQSDADLLSLQARFLCACLKHCPNEVYFAAPNFVGIIRLNFLSNADVLINHSTQVARVLNDLGRSEHKNAFKRYYPMLLADFMYIGARNPLPLEGRRALTPSIKQLFKASEDERMQWLLVHLDQQSRDYLQDFRS